MYPSAATLGYTLNMDAGMVAYVFEYFAMQVDWKKVGLMAESLGNRRVLEPLRIKDKTLFWLLNVS